MVISMHVTVKGMDRVRRRERQLKQLPDDIRKEHMRYALRLRDSLRRTFVAHRKLSPRNKTAQRMTVKRVKDNVIHVLIPRSAHLLDSSRPHYVALKKGRRILKWAQKWYDPKKTSLHTAGRSRVYRGPKGGMNGVLFVTPDPFVEEARYKVRDVLKDGLHRVHTRRVNT